MYYIYLGIIFIVSLYKIQSKKEWYPYNDLLDCKQIKMTQITKSEFINQKQQHYYVIQEKMQRISRNQGYRIEKIEKCIDEMIEKYNKRI